MSSAPIVMNKFNDFDVYQRENQHTFIFADFANKDIFLDGLTNYVLAEENLLNYASRQAKVNFKGTLQQYVKLYRNINMFLNSKLETLSVGENISEELTDILGEEYVLVNNDGDLLVQTDKIGKMGEYIFHLLLTDYFQFDCIVPKFRCITDRNMSVFGIDSLFLDASKKVIYFGESKVCNSLANGIKLVNKSLEDYESQISEEYKLILSSDDAFALSEEFLEIFGDMTQICVSFEQLVSKANINTIGIPIFIAHGNNRTSNTPEDYIRQMEEKIIYKKYFELGTQYILISLPVFNKTEFIELLMKKVVKKHNEYAALAK